MSTVFVINPGSTSTKLALFRGEEELFSHELQHNKESLAVCGSVNEQAPLRLEAIHAVLEEHGVNGSDVDAIAGRGGLLAPMPGGVYEVSDKMLGDLRANTYGEHPCNLGAPLAQQFAKEWAVPAYIVDSVVTDEMEDYARLTGLPEMERRSVFHALNQRGAAQVIAGRIGCEYEECCMVVAHMGGGMSIGAHHKGRVVDVTNGLDGEGPFTPERTGTLPVLPLLERMRDGESFSSLRLKILREGGLWAHLGSNDLREIETRMKQGDAKCGKVFEAMIYNLAKHVAAMIPAALGREQERLDAIVLTGGMAQSPTLVEELTRWIAPMGPIELVAGSVEMQALAQGVCRVLAGKQAAQTYCG